MTELAIELVPHRYEPDRWVCRCTKPNCFKAAVGDNRVVAQARLHDHICPWFAGGTTSLDWRARMMLVEQVWKMLDDTMDELMALDAQGLSVTGRDANVLKARARAQAEILAIFMQPFFTTPDGIAKEAGVRYKARRDGIEHKTNGIDHLYFKNARSEPQRTHAEMKADPTTQDRRNVKRPMTTKPIKLNDQQINSIKTAMESGMFPIEVLAKTYGVSVDIITEVCA